LKIAPLSFTCIMEKEFYLLEKTRNNVISSIENLTIEELNKIPDGFNNNIAWNVGHLIVTQQLLCYKLSGLPVKYEDSMIKDLMKGSAPTQEYKNIDITFFKNELITTIEGIKEDYNSGKFKEYKTYETSYGVELNSVEDAIAFNNLHEAMHLGYIFALKRAL